MIFKEDLPKLKELVKRTFPRDINIGPTNNKSFVVSRLRKASFSRSKSSEFDPSHGHQ